MSTLASDCNAIERTQSFAPVPGLKLLSRLPLALSRAILLRFVPLTAVKPPPMSTLPSDWRAMEMTGPFAPGLLKTGVQSPIGVEPGNAADPNEQLAIRLHDDRINNIGGVCARIETGVQTPVGIEAYNPVVPVRAIPSLD